MQDIQAQDLFGQLAALPVVDVRTPAEFARGHIPGAINLPLFSNEERAEVGTLYKQAGRELAYLRALDFAGARMSHYVTEAIKAIPEKKAVVHCWRGGMRSKSMGLLLDFSGFEVNLLAGGYKAYRQYILAQYFQRRGRFIVLGGYTGTGKTEMLRHLAAMGEQVIDLEALARHKGSAFGALGEQPQPTVEQFENDLFAIFSKIDPDRRTWVENESRSIGRVFLPPGFWEQIKSSVLLHVEMPFNLRVGRLIDEYAVYPKPELEEALLKLQKRMGGQHVKAALEAFRADDLETATSIALSYYDKTYLHATSRANFAKKLTFNAVRADAFDIAQQLIVFANEHHL